MRELFQKNKICAIMRNIDSDYVEEYAAAAVRGGINMFEVAMNSGDACRQIRLLKDRFGDRVHVGAGTVISQERCRIALDAGADFFLTPSVNTGTIEFCLKNQLPVLPGVMSPTDVDICLYYGITVMKLFPAGDLPPSYVKSLKGPFDQTDYVAVGGVSGDNIRDFFANGFIGVGIGSNLFPGIGGNRNWDEAESYIAGIVRKAMKREAKEEKK